MNLVIIRHNGGNGKFLFRVPQGVYLEAGETVYCNNAQGNNQFGVCATSSFEADPRVVAPLWGASAGNHGERLARVVARAARVELNWDEDAQENPQNNAQELWADAMHDDLHNNQAAIHDAFEDEAIADSIPF